MAPDEPHANFGQFDPTAHEREAKSRWPATYREAWRRTSSYGPDEWRQAAAEGDAIRFAFGELLRSGEPPDGTRAVEVAERHRMSIDRWYYPCSKLRHIGLGQMYLDDARFTRYWDDPEPGLAQYVHDAIIANGRA